MILENQIYSLGGSTTDKKILMYNFDKVSCVISDLWIYEGKVSLEDRMFLPETLKKIELENIDDIRESIAGLKLKLATDHKSLDEKKIKVKIKGLEVS